MSYYYFSFFLWTSNSRADRFYKFFLHYHVQKMQLFNDILKSNTFKVSQQYDLPKSLVWLIIIGRLESKQTLGCIKSTDRVAKLVITWLRSRFLKLEILYDITIRLPKCYHSNGEMDSYNKILVIHSTVHLQNQFLRVSSRRVSNETISKYQTKRLHQEDLYLLMHVDTYRVIIYFIYIHSMHYLF